MHKMSCILVRQEDGELGGRGAARVAPDAGRKKVGCESLGGTGGKVAPLGSSLT